jgi:hypothetical protein
VAFPLSPINGQTAVLNGITYAYNSAKGAWIRVAGTVTATAVLSVTSSTQSVSTTTGALIVTGGVGIGGNLNVGGTIASTGSGGSIVGAALLASTVINITGTATSTSTNTGALQVTGGAGIGGNLYVGGNIITTGSGGSLTGAALISTTLLTVISTANSTSTTTGAAVITGGLGVGGNIYFGGGLYQNGVLFTGGGSSTGTTSTFTISNTTSSTSTTTGALTVTGGVGIGGNVNIGGTVTGGGIRTTSTSTAPTNPTVGDIWYNTATDDIARWTTDGANAYWLDTTGPTVSGLTVQNTSVYANSFNGSSQYLTTPSNAAFQFGTGNFTIEGWFYVNTVAPAYQSITAFRSGDTPATIGWSIRLGTSTFATDISDGTTNYTVSHQTAVSANTWYHFAAVRSGTVITIYLNGIAGTSPQTVAAGYTINGSGPTVYVGYASSGSVLSSINGSISNLRIVKGTALYTANFTIPSAPLAAITNTSLLTCQTIPVIDASSNNFTVTNVGSVGLSILSAQQTTAALNTNSPIILPDASQFSTANSFGLHNRLINGAVAIDQRNAGASQTVTAAAALAYTVDRWYAYSTGANVTGQRVAGLGALQYLYQFTGAASTTAIGFGQRIEAANSYDLNNTTVTLSAFLANSLLSTVTWTAYYATTADTFGTLASPTRTQIATGTWTVSSSLARYTANIVVPAAATTGIEIVFTVGAQTSGTWQIGAVQFEPGTVATPFERRPIGAELALCQRYLPAYNATTADYPVPALGQVYSTTQAIITYTFGVQPRVAPTGITVNNQTYFSLTQAASTRSTTSAVTFNNATLFGGVLSATATGLVAGNTTMLWTSNATAQLLWTGCEL